MGVGNQKYILVCFREDILRIFNFDDLIYEKENIDLLKKINLSNDVCLNINGQIT